MFWIFASAGGLTRVVNENGVLVLTAKDRVRLLPPLNIPNELLDRAVAVLKQAIAP